MRRPTSKEPRPPMACPRSGTGSTSHRQETTDDRPPLQRTVAGRRPPSVRRRPRPPPGHRALRRARRRPAGRRRPMTDPELRDETVETVEPAAGPEGWSTEAHDLALTQEPG